VTRWWTVLVLALLGCGRLNYLPLEGSNDSGMDAEPRADSTITVDSHVDSDRPLDSSSDTSDTATPIDSAAADTTPADSMADAPPPDTGTPSCTGTVATTCPDMVRAIGMGESVMVTGVTAGVADDSAGSCGGAGAGELTLQLDLASFGFYDISTAGSDFDTVVYIRDGSCTTGETTCVDDVLGAGGESFTFGAGHAGTFFVIVDGASNQCGTVRLQIDG